MEELFEINKWQQLTNEYLGRLLNNDEKSKIKGAKVEFQMNKKIDDMQTKLNLLRFKISSLSNFEGNCLYESIGSNMNEKMEEVKKKIKIAMNKYKDKKVIKDQELTLKEAFETYNDVEYVKLNGARVRYTYDIIKMDVFQDGGWRRMPTEVLLNLISFIYKKKIVIFRNKNEKGKYTINIINNVHEFEENEKENNENEDEDDENNDGESDKDALNSYLEDNCEEEIYDNKLKKEEIEFIMKESELNNYNIDEIKDDKRSDLILLGLLDETHYVPVKEIKNTENKIVRVRSGYDEDLKDFKRMITNLTRLKEEIKEREYKKNKENNNIYSYDIYDPNDPDNDIYQ